MVTKYRGMPRLTITSGSKLGATNTTRGATTAAPSHEVPALMPITTMVTTSAAGTAQRGASR